MDDEPAIRHVLAKMVKSLGHHVAEASDADEALAMMREAPAQIALCDIRMPGHDGQWLIERLGQEFPLMPVAIVSGADELDPRLTLRPGVVGYVLKPVELDQLRWLLTVASDLVGDDITPV